MAINRYTQVSAPIYNPLSFNELAFAPTFLRQRHDETNAATAQLVQQLGDYNVLSQYQDAARQFIDPLEQDINTLAEDLANRGVTESNAVNNLTKLAAQRSQLYSPRGAVGQLQERTRQYQSTVAQIQEQFKDEPLIANYLIRQIDPGQATLGDNNSLQLGEFRTPTYTRHIPQAEILDRLNTAISSLDEQTLAQTGLQGVGKLNSFEDLYVIAQQQGVPLERINALVNSMVAPEELASIIQYGQATGLTPEQSIQSFQDQLTGLAQSRAYSTVDNRYFQSTRDFDLYAAKKRLDEELDKPLVPFIAPSGRISSASINPFTDLQFKDGKPTYSDNILNSVQAMPVYRDSKGNIVSASQATEIVGGVNPRRVTKPGYTESYEKQVNTEVLDKSYEAFQQIKNSNEELRNLSNEKALERINQYYDNITQRYGTSFKGSLDNKALASNVIAMAPNASVWGPEGTAGELEMALEQLGFDNYADFRENGHDTFAGLNLFGPSGKPAYEFTVEDSKGKKTSMFIEADLGTQQIAERSSNINQMVLNGELISPEGFRPAQRYASNGQVINALEIDVNPVGTNSEPYKLQIVNLNVPETSGNVQEQLQRDIAGKSPKELESLFKNKYNITSGKDYIITPLSNIIKSETDQILRLQQQYNKQ